MFLLSFTIFGAYHGALLCLGQWILPTRRQLNYLLAVMFICLSLLQATTLLFVLGGYETFPRLTLLHIPVLGLLGPVIYGIHKCIQAPGEAGYEPRLRNKHHIVPAGTGIVYIALCCLPEERIVAGLHAFRSAPTFQANDLWYLVPLVILLLYISALAQGSKMLFTRTVLKEEWTARLLLYLVVAAFINHAVCILYFVDRDPRALLAGTALMALSHCVSYLIGRRYPAYFQNLHEVAQATRRRYVRSLLAGEDLEILRENLLQTMERDCLYRDENLSLATLADDLAISPHQLSEFMNDRLGKNFAVFVNEYRIREARELLRRAPERSILDIGYEVGFRSKTSFHRAFVKFTGISPSAYREQDPPAGATD